MYVLDYSLVLMFLKVTLQFLEEEKVKRGERKVKIPTSKTVFEHEFTMAVVVSTIFNYVRPWVRDID